jgi:hypothetical protein
MTNTVYSVNHVPVRLTDERWRHIVGNHNDLASYYFEVLETVAILNSFLKVMTVSFWRFNFSRAARRYWSSIASWPCKMMVSSLQRSLRPRSKNFSNGEFYGNGNDRQRNIQSIAPFEKNRRKKFVV